jgi:hypothetical protein
MDRGENTPSPGFASSPDGDEDDSQVAGEEVGEEMAEEQLVNTKVVSESLGDTTEQHDNGPPEESGSGGPSPEATRCNCTIYKDSSVGYRWGRQNGWGKLVWQRDSFFALFDCDIYTFTNDKYGFVLNGISRGPISLLIICIPRARHTRVPTSAATHSVNETSSFLRREQ